MKQIIYLIATLALLVGVSSCKTDCPKVSPDPVETDLKVTTPEIKVKKGEKATIGYTVTPKETKVTFESASPEVATVSETGEVTALLMGQTTITLTAGDKKATCEVIVEDDPASVTQELPLLKFSAKFNKDLHVTDPEVLAYEKKLGRVETGIAFTNHQNFLGFVNTELSTITGVLYGLRAPKAADIIAAYSKESLSQCVRTKAMLNQLGFKDFKEGLINVDNRDEPLLSATKEDDPDVYVRLYNDPKPELNSILYIEFGKRLPPDPIKTKHPIIPDAKDFPSTTAFATLNADKIKTFESNLGLRILDSEKTTENSLYFNTSEAKIAKSNIEYVCYLLTPPLMPPVYINCRLLCVGSQDDVESQAMKDYLKANGFDQKYEITKDQDKELHVYNAQGDKCVVAIRTYEKSPICVMTITLKKDLEAQAKQAVRPYAKVVRCIR